MNDVILSIIMAVCMLIACILLMIWSATRDMEIFDEDFHPLDILIPISTVLIILAGVCYFLCE